MERGWSQIAEKGHSGHPKCPEKKLGLKYWKWRLEARSGEHVEVGKNKRLDWGV